VGSKIVDLSWEPTSPGMSNQEHMPPTSNSTKRSRKAHEPKHLKLLCIESFKDSIGSVPIHSFGVLLQVQATSKVTVLAVKQFNPKKLEMFPKAHDPKHLKLLCIE